MKPREITCVDCGDDEAGPWGWCAACRRYVCEACIPEGSATMCRACRQQRDGVAAIKRAGEDGER